MDKQVWVTVRGLDKEKLKASFERIAKEQLDRFLNPSQLERLQPEIESEISAIVEDFDANTKY
jgi:hypothetical protein